MASYEDWCDHVDLPPRLNHMQHVTLHGGQDDSVLVCSCCYCTNAA